MKTLNLLFLTTFVIILQACTTSKVVVSYDIDVSKYSYVVFGSESTGDRELDDIVMAVQNEIADTRLKVVSAQEGLAKIAIGEPVLSPNIHVSTDTWSGLTSITITFYDYETNNMVIVLKSEGVRVIISKGQNVALSAISKKLRKVFGDKQ